MRQKVPFSLIRYSSSKAKGAFCSCVAWGWHIYNIVESESDPLTHRPVDLLEKEPLKGKWEVHLHTSTKFGEDPSKDPKGDREQTHKQTNTVRIIAWSMMMFLVFLDQVWFGQKYYTPKVRPDQGSNLWPKSWQYISMISCHWDTCSKHLAMFHVTETPAWTTWPSVTFLTDMYMHQ